MSEIKCMKKEYVIHFISFINFYNYELAHRFTKCLLTKGNFHEDSIAKVVQVVRDTCYQLRQSYGST